MTWEVLERHTGRFVNEPLLTITSGGRLNFNKLIAREMKSVGANKLLVLWDKDDLKMAFRMTNDLDARAYKVQYNEKDNSALIQMRPILLQVGYDMKLRRFPVVVTVITNKNIQSRQWEIQLTKEMMNNGKTNVVA